MSAGVSSLASLCFRTLSLRARVRAALAAIASSADFASSTITSVSRVLASGLSTSATVLSPAACFWLSQLGSGSTAGATCAGLSAGGVEATLGLCTFMSPTPRPALKTEGMNSPMEPGPERPRPVKFAVGGLPAPGARTSPPTAPLLFSLNASKLRRSGGTDGIRVSKNGQFTQARPTTPLRRPLLQPRTDPKASKHNDGSKRLYRVSGAFARAAIPTCAQGPH
mmetsp:Transcript_15571/g.34663  ORF Transcript_15571/g.34663 Transcript_15571/m.34663 type:complete len:224 (-) Transcript_15571:1363-2034(-)